MEIVKAQSPKAFAFLLVARRPYFEVISHHGSEEPYDVSANDAECSEESNRHYCHGDYHHEALNELWCRLVPGVEPHMMVVDVVGNLPKDDQRYQACDPREEEYLDSSDFLLAKQYPAEKQDEPERNPSAR